MQIVTPKEDSFVLEDGILNGILGKDELKGMKLYVLCVAGAFRKGKSFLLSLLIMYLESQTPDWLKKNDEVPRRFSWEGGPETVTRGIWAWSEVFVMKNSLGEEIAVLLLDTQGAFDDTATVSDNATIFAYSTMISSMQIFNLSSNIQENDLQSLQIFLDYGKVAIKKSENKNKPFQTLIFLIRDWQWEDKFPFGAKGGKRFLDSKLSTSGKKEELVKVRKDILSCFERIKCFLMPYPGCKIANGRHAKQINDIAAPFCDCMEELVKILFSTRDLEPKRIDGSFVTCDSFLGCMKPYMVILQKKEMPTVDTVLQASAQAQNSIALAAAFRLYKKKMDESLKDKSYLEESVLMNIHEKNREEAVNIFRNEKKLGGKDTSKKYESILEEDIKTEFQRYSELNDSKNIFKVLQQPFFSFVGLVSTYLAPSVLGLAGFPAFVCYLICAVSGYSLVSWGRDKGRALLNSLLFWRQPQNPASDDRISGSDLTIVACAVGALIVCSLTSIAETLSKLIPVVAILVAGVHAYRSGYFNA